MTMSRKLSTLAVATALAAFGFTALAAQDFGKDDESPLHKLMEKVQVQNATILKGVRNPVQFKKSQEDVVKAAQELGKLGKEAKDFTEPAKEQKQPQEKWASMMEKFVKESDNFAKKAEEKDVKQIDVKNAYKDVQKSCTDCHDIFRPDDF
jgi:cytochrome c556